MNNSAMHETARRLIEAVRIKKKLHGPVGATQEVAQALGVTIQVLTNWTSRGVSKDGMINARDLHSISTRWIQTGMGEMFELDGQPDVLKALGVMRQKDDQARSSGQEAQPLILDKNTVPQDILTWERVLSPEPLPPVFSVAMPDAALEPKIPMGTVIDFRSTAELPRPGACVLVEDSLGTKYIRRVVDAGGGCWIAKARHDAYLSLTSTDHGLRVLAVMTGYRVITDEG